MDKIPGQVNQPVVRLADVMIAWKPARDGEPGQIGVCKHPDIGGLVQHLPMWVKPEHHHSTDKKPRASKLMLMLEAWHIACRDGVPLADIHAALSAIPEYNDMLAEDFSVLEPSAGLRDKIQAMYQASGFNANDLMKAIDREFGFQFDASLDDSMRVYHGVGCLIIVSTAGYEIHTTIQ